MEGIQELKSVLRSLVVSSPTQVDLRTLLRDYRSMMGAPLPIAKYGYKDALVFLKERCSDCFLFQGLATNPVLTLIVTENLKHIDTFVQRQKVPTTHKFKGKRRSVQDTEKFCEVKPNNHQKKKSESPKKVVEQFKSGEAFVNGGVTGSSTPTKNNIDDRKEAVHHDRSGSEDQEKPLENENYSRADLHNFLKKRLPMYNSSQDLENASSNISKNTSDSSRQASSTSSNSKRAQLEELKTEVRQLIMENPEGVRCTDLIKLYRERCGRELPLSRFGLTSVVALASLLQDVHVSRDAAGAWRACGLQLGAHGPRGPHAQHGPRAPPAAPLPRPLPRPMPRHAAAVDPEDALPGIDFDPDVFPSDCMHFMESIPTLSLAELRPGDMVPAIVGELYSPSHFWLIRLGDEYNVAMETMMDEMTEYYERGEGRERRLALGAVRVGHYCSSVYERDWHRSLIVRLLDADTVKVRHVDYGTVDTVSVAALRPLLRRWARLPAQAVRARLAAVRPGAAGRRWPHAACAHLLGLVRDTRLVANLVALDPEEDILEVLLIDTSTEEDVSIGDELIRSGHADPRPTPALRVSVPPSAAPAAPRAPLDDTDDDSDADVRSLITAISHFRDECSDSDVSASASQLVGSRPRRLPEWEPPLDGRSVASTLTSRRLRRLRALHSRVPAESTVDGSSKSTAGESVVDSGSSGSGDSVTSMSSRLLRFKLAQMHGASGRASDARSEAVGSSVSSLRLRRLRALRAHVAAPDREDDSVVSTVADSVASTVVDSVASTVVNSSASTVVDSSASTVVDSSVGTVVDSSAGTVVDSSASAAVDSVGSKVDESVDRSSNSGDSVVSISSRVLRLKLLARRTALPVPVPVAAPQAGGGGGAVRSALLRRKLALAAPAAPRLLLH